MDAPNRVLDDLATYGPVERNLAALLPLLGVSAVSARLGVEGAVIETWIEARRVPAEYGAHIWAALAKARQDERDGPCFRHNGRWQLYIEARESGKRVCEIAREFGVTHQAIVYALKEIR